MPRQFLNSDALKGFLASGTEYGVLYGQRGQGTGRMPGFGDNPNTDEPEDGMFTEEMLDAITRYERSLGGFAQGTRHAPRHHDTTTTEEP